MARIKLNDKELDFLISRYKSIITKVSGLAMEINQMINRLEPSLMTSGDIDIRLTSMLRSLQNCEEYLAALVSHINIAVEQFSASDKRITSESNELIYEFKQILHQIKNNGVLVLPNQTAIKDKEVVDGMFEARSHIDSVKLKYIAEVAGITELEVSSDENH